MSTLNSFEKTLTQINKIPAAEIKIPRTIPVDVYLQEAENLHHWSYDDRLKLAARGLDLKFIDELPIRCEVLRVTQSQWNNSRFSSKDAELEWQKLAPFASNFRKQLLHELRFAYRKDKSLSSKIGTISQGSTHADIIQSLNDLAVLGRENPDKLKVIKFNPAKLDEAARLSSQMADLLGATYRQRADLNISLDLRNRAFTHLKEAVDAVREFGKFVFWQDEKRSRGYASEYLRKIQRRYHLKKQSSLV